MSSLRPKLVIILPLLIGVGMLWALTQKWKHLTQLEHSLFLFPERFEPEKIFPDRGNLGHFRVTPLNFSGEEKPRSLASYLIDEKTRDIINLTPEKWAYFIDTIHQKGDGLLVITAPLSWSDASELSLQTLDHQISQCPNLVIGLDAEFNNTSAPLPPFLKSSVISSSTPDFLHLPQIDFFTFPPSVKAPLFGISTVQGLIIETSGKHLKVPMIVRWGDFLLPSTHLAALIASHQLTPQDVIIDPSGYLRIGQDGPILTIDSQGRATLPNMGNTPLSASDILIHPEKANSSKIILPPNSPQFLTSLETHLTQALSQKPKPLKTYTRWSVFIEISALILLTLVLQARRLWLALLGVSLIFILSISQNHWFPSTPVALLLATFAILPRPALKKMALPPPCEVNKKDVPPPKPKPEPEQTPTPTPKKETPVKKAPSKKTAKKQLRKSRKRPQADNLGAIKRK